MVAAHPGKLTGHPTRPVDRGQIVEMAITITARPTSPFRAPNPHTARRLRTWRSTSDSSKRQTLLSVLHQAGSIVSQLRARRSVRLAAPGRSASGGGSGGSDTSGDHSGTGARRASRGPVAQAGPRLDRRPHPPRSSSLARPSTTRSRAGTTTTCTSSPSPTAPRSPRPAGGTARNPRGRWTAPASGWAGYGPASSSPTPSTWATTGSTCAPSPRSGLTRWKRSASSPTGRYRAGAGATSPTSTAGNGKATTAAARCRRLPTG